MYFKEKHLDDLLLRVFNSLLKSKSNIITSHGPSSELTGVLISLLNPRARLSRTETKGTVFSCLGELTWYLSGTNELEHIKYYLNSYKKYSDDNKTIYGGYGPRLFNMRNKYNQVDNVLKLLKKDPSTRHAVIQLYDAGDIIEYHKDIPCTCTLQFMIRKNRLMMFTSMRSNDAFMGLPHDIFSFTMIQEIMARTLGLEIGTYKHFIGSLHLYHEDFENAIKFIKEGLQSNMPMPPMPIGDPKLFISELLKKESEIRINNEPKIDINNLGLNDYWKDIILLLLIFKFTKKGGDEKLISEYKGMISSKVYLTYIEMRQEKKIIRQKETQLKLGFKK